MDLLESLKPDIILYILSPVLFLLALILAMQHG